MGKTFAGATDAEPSADSAVRKSTNGRFSPTGAAGSPTTSVTEDVLAIRRERVLLVLAGIFLASMTMLNILGVTRFIDLSFEIAGKKIPLTLPLGVLPYPITFLCTDLISELFGRAKASFLVWVGFLANVWLFFILWLGGVLPGTDSPVFDTVQQAALGSVVGSMIAYLAAQFCDVHVFHLVKRATKGKHLWLRNNAYTLFSQFVDTFAVLTLAHFYADILGIDDANPWPALWTIIGSAYVFKLVCALLDTIPAYLLRDWLAKYLEVDPESVH